MKDLRDPEDWTIQDVKPINVVQETEANLAVFVAMVDWKTPAGLKVPEPHTLRVVHLGRSTCHAISGRGD